MSLPGTRLSLLPGTRLSLLLDTRLSLLLDIRLSLLLDILRQAAPGSDHQGQDALLRLLPVVVVLLNPLLLLHLLRFTTTTFLRNLVSLDAISQCR